MIESTRFAHALKRIGFTQRGVSRFLGVNERTVRRWLAEDEPVPPATLMLICLMAKHGLTMNDALASVGIDGGKLDRQAEREHKGRPGLRREPRFFG